MRTLISGASGLVGSALLESLHAKGHTIRCLKRNPDDNSDSIWNTASLDKLDNEREPFTTVIHLAGENVAEGRWTKQRKERILKSRTEGTRQLVAYLATLPKPPEIFICASAIGYYGSSDSLVFTERHRAGKSFLSQVCKEWEKEAAAAEQFARVVNLRFGMVLSPNGGALHKMLPPFKAGLGGPIGKGKQYMSWISIRDLVEIVDFTINNPTISGPVNVVSPAAVTNREFTKALAGVLRRPAILPAPAFGIRLMFGEMADELLLASTRIKPEKLRQAGYSFIDNDLRTTLEYCCR